MIKRKKEETLIKKERTGTRDEDWEVDWRVNECERERTRNLIEEKFDEEKDILFVS